VAEGDNPRSKVCILDMCYVVYFAYTIAAMQLKKPDRQVTI